jgi:hypothetical protein
MLSFGWGFHVSARRLSESRKDLPRDQQEQESGMKSTGITESHCLGKVTRLIAVPVISILREHGTERSFVNFQRRDYGSLDAAHAAAGAVGALQVSA